jgi:hypothetical protein
MMGATDLLPHAGITFCLSWGTWFLAFRSRLTPGDSTRFELAILTGGLCPGSLRVLAGGLVA